MDVENIRAICIKGEAKEIASFVRLANADWSEKEVDLEVTYGPRLTDVFLDGLTMAFQEAIDGVTIA